MKGSLRKYPWRVFSIKKINRSPKLTLSETTADRLGEYLPPAVVRAGFCNVLISIELAGKGNLYTGTL